MNQILNHLVFHNFPDSPLYEEENDVLISVAERFVEKYPKSARKDLHGSFKLVGYSRSGRTQTILSFDFPGGTDIGDADDHNSFELVDQSIERIISEHDFIISDFDDTRKSKRIETLVIPTKYGRFIMAIAMSPRDLGHSFLLQMAITIKQLGYAVNSDRTLTFSVDSIHVSRNDRDEMLRLENELWGNYFSSPEMRSWQHWHRRNHSREKGELGFFFEEFEAKKSPTKRDNVILLRA